MSRMRLLVLLGALLWVTPPSRAEAEWFVDLYAGKSFTLDADLKIDQPANNSRYTVEEVSFSDKSFTDPPYYGVRAGYFLESYPPLGFALEFFHFKILAETGDSRRFVGTRTGAAINTVQPINTAIQRFDVSHGVNYLTVDAIFRNPMFADKERFPKGRAQLYVGVGPGVVIAHPENVVEGVRNNEEYQIGGFGVQAFVGAKVLLLQYLGTFVEYKFSHSRLKVDLSTGDAKVHENTHHLVFGITVPFR